MLLLNPRWWPSSQLIFHSMETMLPTTLFFFSPDDPPLIRTDFLLRKASLLTSTGPFVEWIEAEQYSQQPRHRSWIFLRLKLLEYLGGRSCPCGEGRAFLPPFRQPRFTVTHNSDGMGHYRAHACGELSFISAQLFWTFLRTSDGIVPICELCRCVPRMICVPPDCACRSERG